MKKYIQKTVLLLLCFLCFSEVKAYMTYEIYIEDWNYQACTGPNACGSCWPVCRFSWNASTICNVAFASYGYNPANPNDGVFYGIEQPLTVLQATRDLIHSQGGKIKMAYGGANGSYQFWALSDWQTDAVQTNIANNITSACVGNNLDGVDFDFEAGPVEGSGSALANIIKKIRSIFNNTGHTDKLITLTMPAQVIDNPNYPEFNAVLTGLLNNGQIDYVDHINFMEYCFGINPGNTNITQAQQDIESYHTGSFKIPYNKMALGLEQYCCGVTSCSTGEFPMDAKLANTQAIWANNKGLAGLFYWDLFQEVQYFTPSLCGEASDPNAFPVSYAIRYVCGQPAAPDANSYVSVPGVGPQATANTNPPLGFNFTERETSVAQPDNADTPES